MANRLKVKGAEMSKLSPRLALPIMQPSQAQKHVTHNEALIKLDALVQLVLQDTDVQIPPATETDGAVWAVGDGATGAWTGKDGQLAQWNNRGWAFIAPQTGWRCWDLANSVGKIFDGTAWSSLDMQNLPGLGINSASDGTNRLVSRSQATLLTHDGAGHQLKVNKAAANDTACLLYQTDFTGHAEIGLAGNNDLSVKVSPDGASWTEALVIDAANGTVGGAAVQTDASDLGDGKLARAEFTYGKGNLLGAVSELAGAPTGAVIETGSNNLGDYLRLADGTQIAWLTKNAGPGDAEGEGTFNNPWSVAPATVLLPIAFQSTPVVNFSFSVNSNNTLSSSIISRYGSVANDRILEFRTARFGSASDSTNVILQCIAIGRWY